MYAQRFGLAREPFSIAPDPRFLFMSERHREALAHLLFGLQGGGGFVLLTGEIGAGKTTVARLFLEQLPAHCNVAYIFNPRLSDIELLQTVCDEFGIAVPEAHRASVKALVDALNAFLLQAHAQGRINLLVIDEAQNLSPSLLEQLRLLTNLETAERKLLQIILIGQPELRTLLARPEMAPLAQRVIARTHLQALSAPETAAYIRHRLGVAGCSGPLPFDEAALRRIHALARGVPRRINLLADRALLGAYAGGRERVDARIVSQAAREVFGEDATTAGAPRPLAAAALALAGVALLGTAAWALWPGGGTAVGPTASPGPGAATTATAATPPHLADRPPSTATAAAAATPAAPTATPAAAGLAELATLLPRLPRDEAEAWPALAALWPADAQRAGAAPCADGLPLRCHRGALTLAQIRQLDRPGLLLLRGADARPAYALLAGLDQRAATLLVDGERHRVPLPLLARHWQGEFATLWRAPQGLPAELGSSGTAAIAGWLGEQLARIEGDGADAQRPLRERLATFQRAQGLKPDGVAGPMTLMQLNRAAGIAEPRLVPES